MDVRGRVTEMRLVPADQLTANPSNWRRHPQVQQRALSAVLDEVGFAGAVIAREDDDGHLIIIDGHARAEMVGDATVPVLVTDLTEAEADVVLATYDPIGAMAQKDHEAFTALASRIDTANETLLGLLGRTKDGETDPDEVPNVPAEAQSERGVVYELGPHRVMCGDATEPNSYPALLGGTPAEMMFTDPPYGVDYDGGHFHSGDVDIKRPRPKLSGDDTDIYKDFVPVVLAHVDGPCYMWFAGSRALRMYQAVGNAGAEIHALLIWNKTNATYAAMNAQYKQRHEPCLYFKPAGATLRWSGPTTECTVWDEARDPSNDLHPTQKPIALPARAIRNHDAKVILDPFLGSGTTLIAAEQAGRVCYGMEIEPRYVDVIRQRYADFVGNPSLAPDG